LRLFPEKSPLNVEETPLAIGMPVKWRNKLEQQYFVRSIDSLIQCLSAEQRRHHRLIVLLADTDAQTRDRVFTRLSQHFCKAMEEGFLQIANPPTIAKPENAPTQNKLEYGNWKSKLATDTAHLMQSVHHHYGHWKYYLHLEDDIVVNSNTFSIQNLNRARAKVAQKHPHWIALKFEKRRFWSPGPTYLMGGFHGLLFQMQHLLPFIQFVYRHHNHTPIDWLLGDYLLLQCNKLHYVNSPMFTNIGKYSTKTNSA